MMASKSGRNSRSAGRTVDAGTSRPDAAAAAIASTARFQSPSQRARRSALSGSRPMRCPQSGGRSSTVNRCSRAYAVHGLRSAEWSHAHPRSIGRPKVSRSVHARPPTRPRASSTRTARSAPASARAAVSPAAPAPTTTTSSIVSLRSPRPAGPAAADPRVVDEDVDVSRTGSYPSHSPRHLCVDRDPPDRELFRLDRLVELGHGGGTSHAGIDVVAQAREVNRGRETDTAAATGDQDDGHGETSWATIARQGIPPRGSGWPSAFSPGGGGGGAGSRGGGAGGAQTPGLPATSMDAFTLIPGGAPAGDPVPEPTAHDLFQLALALALWLAFRRLSA